MAAFALYARGSGCGARAATWATWRASSCNVSSVEDSRTGRGVGGVTFGREGVASITWYSGWGCCCDLAAREAGRRK